MTENDRPEGEAQLDLSNCRCSRHHTCDWCLEHREQLLSGEPDSTEVVSYRLDCHSS